jgi:glycosyltransferase involved in cell wall biosynthesis
MAATKDRTRSAHGTGRPGRSNPGRQPVALVIGPLPPPLMGPAIGTEMIHGAFERSGVRVVLVNTQDRRTIFNMGVLDLRNVVLGVCHVAQTAVLAARERPDVAYLPISQGRWGYVRDAALMAVLRALQCPFVVHLRGSAFQTFYAGSGRLERLVIRRTLGWAARGIVLTPELVHVFDGLIPAGRIRTLENGIRDPYPGGIAAVAERRRRRARASPRSLRVLYVANDWTMKGAPTLVQALAHPGLEEVELRLAGAPREGEVREAQELAGRLGLLGRIRVVGSISGEAKADEYAWADVLAHPTENDGQPLVVIEAMAAGLAVVASRIGGIPETLGDDGLLVQSGDPVELAAALVSLVEDPAHRLRLGEASRQRFLDRYTPEPYQRRFVELFSELLRLEPCAD